MGPANLLHTNKPATELLRKDMLHFLVTISFLYQKKWNKICSGTDFLINILLLTLIS